MSHAHIEEVSNSDPSEGDISDVSDDFNEQEIIKARAARPTAPSASKTSLINSSTIPSSAQPFPTTKDDSKYKDFQCIYPIYFDKMRSRKDGRMVGVQMAVENPLAREIVNACGRLGLETLFEPAKTHPRDWANPGRVRVKLRAGKGLSIKNKHHLYLLISRHLIANPTTIATAKAVRVPGVPLPDPSKDYPCPAVPKGWKIGTILPHYSPAITGGGISENFFKDVMAEMQQGGGLPGGVGGMPDMAALQGMMGGLGGLGGSTGGNPSMPKKQKKKGKT